MKEKRRIKLRKNPLLEITFSENFLEVQNNEIEDENGKYEYKFIESVEFKEKKPNSLLTNLRILTHFISLQFPNIFQKGKPIITLKYKGMFKRISLNNCDNQLIEKFVKKLNIEIGNKPIYKQILE